MDRNSLLKGWLALAIITTVIIFIVMSAEGD